MKVQTMRKIVGLIVAFAAGLWVTVASALTLQGTFTGKTYYVSKSGSNGAATDWASAKTTIQAAVDLCADGDTVIVDDGDYSETTNYTVSGQGDVPTVVVIRKRIHLVSRNGKAKTAIVGKWSDDGKGAGTGAHRGIHSTAANVLVEGFTIRNCAAPGASAGVNNYFANGGGMTASAAAYVVDCTIDNCRAGQGGAVGFNVRLINCLVSNCRANGVIQVGYRTGYAGYNTIFVNCGDGVEGHVLFSNVQNETAVNCTFLANKSAAGYQNKGYYTYLKNCAFLDAPAETAARTVQSNCVRATSKYQYLSPMTGDWRTVKDAEVIDMGSAVNITAEASWIPTEYQAVDFLGNPRQAGASVDAGAIEAQDGGVVPATGFITFSETATVTAEGVATVVNDTSLWLGYETFPGQLRVVPTLPAGKTFYGYILGGCWNSYAEDFGGGFRYPDRNADGGIWLTPPPVGERLTLAQKIVGNVLRVPSQYATLQEASDAAVNWDLILVAPGRYTGTGDQVVTLTKAVAMRSEEGPETTIIDGEGERRCVVISSKSNNAMVQGFTLTGGYNLTNGGGFYSSPLGLSNNDTLIDGIRPQLADCIISNNVAKYAAGATGGWIQRCLFTDNRQTEGTNERGAAVRNSLVTGSVIRDNPDGNIAAAAYCRIYNTTFAEAGTSALMKNAYRPFDRNTTVINCAVYGGYADNANTAITAPAGNVRETGTGAKEAWLTTYAAGEVFADGEHGDYRLLAGTEAVTKGSVTAADVLRFQTGDIEGKAIRYRDGVPLPGAYQTPVGTITVSLKQDFPVEPGRIIAATPGVPVTITVKPDAVHPVYGWVVDGVTNLTAETSITVTPSGASSSLALEPLIRSVFYVDANDGNDAADGLTSATAKKTLAAVLAPTIPGDVVYAAAGDYKDGQQVYEQIIGDLKNANPATYHPSRAVIPAGVSLIATAGKDETVIWGAFDTTSTSEKKGPGAIRCVTMLAGSRLVGFTVRNGATANTTGTERNDNAGGGILAPWPVDGDVAGSALIEDCVIRDCHARTAGGAYGGILHKCRIFDTTSTSGGSCCEHARIDQCVLLTSARQSTVRLPHGIVSTTLIAGASSFGSNSELLSSGGGSYSIENSILITPNAGSSCTLKNVRNVLWCSDMGATGKFGTTTLDEATCANVTSFTATSLANALQKVGLDVEGRPLSATAMSVDQGDTALAAKLMDGATDLAGAARVVNDGKIDLGAYEFDWRPVYAAELAKRGAAVESADPSVSVAAEGGLKLPTGAVSATWQPPTANLTVRQTVTLTGGRLDVTVNGVLLQSVTTAGATTLTLPPTTAEAMTLDYVFTPASETDAAVLGKLDYSIGLCIFLR